MIKWYKSGEPWIWLTAAAVSVNLIIVVGLLLLIAGRGLGHFWPSQVVQMDYTQPGGATQKLIGEVVGSEQVPAQQVRALGIPVDEGKTLLQRRLIKTGNRDLLGTDFRWIYNDFAGAETWPEQVMVIERREWGNFYGYPIALKTDYQLVAEGEQLIEHLDKALDRVHELHGQIRDIETGDIGSVNYRMEELRLRQRRYELNGTWTNERQQELAAERATLDKEFAGLQAQLQKLNKEISRSVLTATVMDGRAIDIPLSRIVRVYQPNSLGLFGRVGVYLSRLREFIFDEPREANTEGGIFPAIFGTVMMVLIMSALVTPFGVIAAVYLREYARQNAFTRTIRIAVNNLAGVPSIVYGVFGLGFFVYFLGGNIDQLFFPEALPAPTFGTPGILWSSLTLAILTVPVVIVATEEGLSRIPRSIREGSLALGATKAETLWRTVLPMATPAMMTGVILAIARAAGEVAPLMLVGVVKLAPSLPLDGNFPFLHLDRKFMHLGFHIYDVGFQSPNVEAARPLVYATAFFLVLVIVILNLTAIYVRNQLRERYRALEN